MKVSFGERGSAYMPPSSRGGRSGAADARGVRPVPGVRRLDALVEGDRRAPAEACQPGDVEELARSAVGLARVPRDRAVVTHDLRDDAGQLGDRDVGPGADV